MSIQPVSSPAPSRVTSAAPNPRQHPPENTGATTDTAQASNTANLTQTAPPEPKKAQDARNELDRAVKDVSEFVKTANNSLQFSIDDDLGRTVVKVIDTGTKELIRQIPSEEMLSIAKALDSIKGLLVQQKA